VVASDGTGTVLWANEAAERLFGLDARQAAGHQALGFVHPDDLPMALRSLDSVKGKQVGTPIEIRVRTPDGWRLVEVVGANLLDDPAVGAIVLCLRDLTERRRWEVGRDKVSRFKTLVHNAATIVALVDAGGRVQSVSGALTRQLGHDPERVEGRPLAELVRAEDRPALVDLLDERHPSRPRTRRLEVSMVPADGSAPVPFELEVVDLLDDPTVEGLVVSAHDVSALRRSMEQLAAAQAELARGERLAAVGRLAAMIGHELRNPLAAVTNALYLVRHALGAAVTGEVERQLALAERETLRAAALAEDLVSYVRTRPPVADEVELGRVLSELLEATPPPEGVGVELAVEPVTLRADPEQLRQVLTNLVANAYEASPRGATVRIGATSHGARAEIRVEDEGPGIDAEAAERAFEPFFSTKAQGTGLGLAIAARLVEAHGGTVALANRPGGGAQATVWLPLEGPPSP
jgi:PAS domain S-box-containing protein